MQGCFLIYNFACAQKSLSTNRKCRAGRPLKQYMLNEYEIERCRYILDFNLERFWLRIAALITFAVITLLQWLIVAGISVFAALALDIVIAWVVSYYYQGLRHATPNGVSTKYARISVGAFGVVLSALWFILIGAWQLAQLKKGGAFNKPLFVAWLAVCVAAPALFLSFRYWRCRYRLRRQYRNYVRVYLHIYHDNDLPILPVSISFVNKANGRSVHLDLKDLQYEYYSQEELMTLGLSGRLHRERHMLFGNPVYIPMHTDTFYLSWYSPVDGRHYSDAFPFPFEKFILTADTLAGAAGIGNARRLAGIDLDIGFDGHVNLYSGNVMLFYYRKVAHVALPQEQQDVYEDNLRQQLLPGYPAAAFTSLINEIRTSERLLRKRRIQEKRFLWKITLTGLGDIRHSVTITDVNCNCFDRPVTDQATTLVHWFLPQRLRLFKRVDEDHYFYVTILLNYHELYNVAMSLTAGDEAVPVHLTMHVTNAAGQEMECSIHAAGQSVCFGEWQLLTTN